MAVTRRFFTWYINTHCNYHCSYCRPEQIEVRTAPTPLLLERWDDIYRRYGSCHVSFSGGEPFIYPGFIDLLGGMTRHHSIEVITNLSFDVQPLIDKVDLKKVRMGCSFHPETAGLEDFLGKMVKLKAYDFEKWVTFVAYPTFLDKMGYYRDRFEKEGIRFSILPFKGQYEGREYPRAYSEEERKLISEIVATDEVNRKTFDWQNSEAFRNDPAPAPAQQERPAEPVDRGLCRMGQQYARIYPDGNAFRCCVKGAQALGNIYDGTFRLLDEPAPCHAPVCPCWKRMVAGKEEEWSKYWVVPYGLQEK